jgi:glycolate oxidase
MSLKDRLTGIVGASFVSDSAGDLYIYGSDMTENPPRNPALVVMPSTTDEVRRIIELANETLTPLVPFVTGQNVGGLTIPQVEDAVIVDLKRLNRILEVDEEAMYMLVEPGVTFGDVRAYLDKHHPRLRYTYPIAPPYTSVVANALLQGLCDLSSVNGAMADFINGLEAVLPNGHLVRVGSGISGEQNWFGRYPLPDLVGLFSGWQGMTGIVTKMSLKLWPKRRILRHSALFSFGEENTVALLKTIARTGVIEDLDCMSLTIIKGLIGVKPPIPAIEGEPDYATLIAISANTEVEYNAKFAQVKEIVQNSRIEETRNSLVTWNIIVKLMGEEARDWIDFPSNSFKPLAQHDGVTWMGTYIHPKNWAKALARGRAIVEKHGFETMAFLKAMDSLHFAEFKFIIRFPKDEAAMKRVRRCNDELLTMALTLGAIPYKTPVWSAKKLHEHIDPEFIELVKQIKKTIDPNNIMNPGRWGL